MNAFDSALAGLRIGPVPYLNAKPLIWGLRASLLETDVPANLSRKFFSGQLDVALLPVFEVLRAGEARVVDDVAIACRGEVYSVIVASKSDFADARTIYLDPASRTSAALLRVLIAEYYPAGPSIAEGQAIPEGAARLLIGDAAIEFRRTHGGSWRYHDLGALWQKHTGLPFVFAVWAVSDRATLSTCNALRHIKTGGLAARREIASKERDPVFALNYLTKFIHYGMGNDEKMSIRRFEKLAAEHRLLSKKKLATLDFC